MNDSNPQYQQPGVQGQYGQPPYGPQLGYYPPAAPPPQKKKHRVRNTFLGIGVAFVALIIIGVASSGGSGSSGSGSGGTTAAGAGTSTSTAATPSASASAKAPASPKNTNQACGELATIKSYIRSGDYDSAESAASDAETDAQRGGFGKGGVGLLACRGLRSALCGRGQRRDGRGHGHRCADPGQARDHRRPCPAGQGLRVGSHTQWIAQPSW